MTIKLQNHWRIETSRKLVLFCLALAGTAPASLFADERPAGVLPKSADLRPAFTNRSIVLRLQGSRGTCSVFTMTGAIEYALAGKQPHAPLSVEFLNWASNEAAHEAEDGSFFSDLWTGFSRHGLCLETNMPYAPKFDPARRPGETALQQAREALQAGLRFHWIKPWDVNTGLTDAHFAEIKATLANQWPVCGGFRWPKEEHWKDGILEMRPPEGVFDGHSVLLVGFRDDPRLPGGGLFLIRNSGKGDHDAAMSYAYVRAYMNDAAWVELPAETKPAASTAPAGR